MMSSNPLSAQRQKGAFGQSMSIDEFVKHHNKTAVSRHYGWFWYLRDIVENEEHKTILRKFEMKYLGTPSYILENPDRAEKYVRSAVGDQPIVIKEILDRALKKST